jgi:hypothetical protein
MKKILLLVIVALFTMTIVYAQTGWVTHKADNRVSVKFPNEPHEISPGSVMSMLKDSSMVYVFTMVDFVQVAGIDSVALAPIKATPEFASQLKSGIGRSLPGVNFADFTIGSYKGFTSYTSSGLDAKNKKYDMFMFIIGNKLYSLSTIMASTIATTKSRDDYFASIVISN